MSVDQQGIFIRQSQVNINRGSDKQFNIKLFDQDGNPFNLTNYVQFQICIKISASNTLTISETANANGSTVDKDTPNELGRLLVDIKAADVATLRVMEGQDIDLKIAKAAGAEPRTFHFNNVLNVFDNLCA